MPAHSTQSVKKMAARWPAVAAGLMLMLAWPASAQLTIQKVAGARVEGENIPALSVSLDSPSGVALDSSGNLFVADSTNHRIRKVTASGTVSTVAGSGTWGYSGDGGAATAAYLSGPSGVAIDSSGNFYFADQGNNRIRKVSASGTITTVAGTGAAGYGGDGAAATAAQLNDPSAVALDSSGSLYIADTSNHRIRKVSISGTISTVAGTGAAGYGGDGAAATAALLNAPAGVALDSSGSLYIADTSNHRIRKVDAEGTISTVAGTGTAGYGGDGAGATAAQLRSPSGVSLDSSGSLYIADTGNHCIRKVASEIISTVAGSGTMGYFGDGAAATAAMLHYPCAVAPDGSGSFYIADTGNNRIRKVNGSGTIGTVAGNGTSGYFGNGGPATAAGLNQPSDVALDSSGNLYISDSYNYRIRKVSAAGVITTVAGSGSGLYYGDGGPATAAGMMPFGLALDSSGNIYCADTMNSRIRRIDASGVITTVAGNGSAGFSGDGGAATAAMLYFPSAVVLDGSGNLYIADAYNHRIRKVNTSGVISTVAGDGTPLYSGDGGAATAAGLNQPTDVAVDSSGNLYISDTYNYRIRKVATSGIITTLAGTGDEMYSGDGGPADEAGLSSFGMFADSSGNLFFADRSNQRIRKVDASGVITTVAGNGGYGYSGDGGPPTAAMLRGPYGVALDSSGKIYIADTANHIIRKVSTDAASTTTTTAAAAVDFSADPVLGPPPLTVQFTAAAGIDAAAAVWDFGDKTAAGTGASPSHTYQSAGTYDVNLSLAGPKGATLKKTKVGYIRVVANAPVASFSASASEGSAPLAVVFNDTSSGAITAREWDFGDGQTGDLARVRHTYAAAGEYTATLKVTGDAGTSSASAIITAKPGTRIFAITGGITGDRQAGIDVSLSGADLNMTAQTAAGGAYGFAGVPNGLYRITPIRPCYTFDPPGVEVRVAGAAMPNNNFTATAAGPSLAQPAVSPEQAPADGVTQVTFTVSISHPLGHDAISSVSADLTAIGGPASALLLDDGTAGDATAGDGVYTLVTAVAAATQPGLKAVRITAADTDEISRMAFAGLDVYRHSQDSLEKNGSTEYLVTSQDIPGQTLRFVLTQTEGGPSGAAPGVRRDSADCSPTMIVISPGGVQSSGQTSGANQTTVEVANAEPGQWTCQVANPCETTISYGLDSSISGSGIVSGLVVDSRTGEGVGGVSLQTTAGIGAQTESGVYVMVHPSGSYSLRTSASGFLPAAKSLTVSAGGATQMNIALDNGTDTGGCFLASSVGEGRQLQALRRYRDEVLAKTAAGRLAIRLYYRLSPVAAGIMQDNAFLQGKVKALVDRLLPYLADQTRAAP